MLDKLTAGEIWLLSPFFPDSPLGLNMCMTGTIQWDANRIKGRLPVPRVHKVPENGGDG